MLYLLYSLLEVLMCVKVLKALRSPAVFTTVFYKVIFVISMTILWNSCYMEHILRNPGLQDKSQKLLNAENEALHSSPPGYLSKFIFLSVISPLWAVLHSQNLQYPHFAFPGKSSLSPSLSCKLLLKLQNSTQPPILQSLYRVSIFMPLCCVSSFGITVTYLPVSPETLVERSFILILPLPQQPRQFPALVSQAMSIYLQKRGIWRSNYQKLVLIAFLVF